VYENRILKRIFRP